MKVGILSLNMYTTDLNPACRVHSYAFQKFLDENGIDNVIIDYFPQHCNAKYDVRHPYDYHLAHPLKNKEKHQALLDKWKLLYDERERRYDLTQAFIEKHLRKTDRQYTTKDLDKLDPGCDIYMAVTDVLWKYRDNGVGFDPAFFLRSKCMDGKGKIALSVSYGGKEYDEEKKKQIEEWTKGIDFVSTREKYLYDLYSGEFGRKASITLDPVFLHDESFYKDITVKPEGTEEKYVFVYNVIKNSKNILKSAVKFAEKRGLKVIEMSDFKENENFPEGTSHKVVYGASVEEWLGYIKNAEYVFTNSFHCCCFSIIFGKQFYAGNRLGTKVQWLLRIFGLQDRWVEKNKVPDGKRINYLEVGALREKFRKQTGNYILSVIRATEEKLQGKEPDTANIEGIENYVLREEFTVTKHYGDETEVQTVKIGASRADITHREIKGMIFSGWYSDPHFIYGSNMRYISTDKDVIAKYIPAPTLITKLGRRIKSRRLRNFLRKILRLFRKLFKK